VRIDTALLCDAATVREGLLHILGGGITQANRPAFPAPIGMMLAMRILVHPTELDQAHHLSVQLQGEDGQSIAKMDAQIGVIDPALIRPHEEASVPLTLGLPPMVQLPAPGRYSFEILIDGIHQSTVPFSAEQLPPQ
jgi:hypothetical protein